MRRPDDGGNAVGQVCILLGMSELQGSLQTLARRLLRVLFVRDIHVSAHGFRSRLLPNPQYRSEQRQENYQREKKFLKVLIFSQFEPFSEDSLPTN